MLLEIVLLSKQRSLYRTTCFAPIVGGHLTVAERKKTELKLSGMTCATCASTIEKALRNLPGVVAVQVNFASEIAEVEYDTSQAKLHDLEQAVTDAGYAIVNEQVVLKVGGMSCVSCETAVTSALKALEGVVSVTVNLATETAYLTYNPSLTTIAEMKAAIESAGYQYLSIEGEAGDVAATAREKDLRSKRLKIIIGFAVGIPLMALTFVSLPLPFPLTYLELVVSTPVFLYIGYPIFNAGFHALRTKTLTMDVMYSMGIGVAFVASILGTFNIVLTPDFMFYETAVLLATFLTLGRYLEAKAKGRTSEAIKKLIGLQAKTATVLRGDTETEVPIEAVQIDDVVIVKPGGKIPVDGLVVDGESAVDESMITGESIPVSKTKGALVIGGTLNTNGVLSVKATKIGKDTMLAQIIKLVETAQGSKPPVQRIADTAVTYFIPTVLAIALGSFAVWYLLLGNTLLFSLTALISVLVIACPCALGLATPTAVTVGIGRGAELGILIKNGDALEVSDKVTTIIFDKTGTLTKGKPEVTDVVGVDATETRVLELAASVEKNSQHPLADAVVKKAQHQDLTIEKTTGFLSYSGKGVQATVQGSEVLIGNRALFKEKNIVILKKIEDESIRLESEGKTVMFVSSNHRLIGLVAIADTLKETSKPAVDALRQMGLKVLMITGDNTKTAAAIAQQIGIERVLAEVLPQEKANEVKRLQAEGEVVAFVGDGINDAPALAQADVGVAIGGGTDVAIESGDIVLVKNDLLDSVAAVQLSRKVMARIKQNLFWAFAYNTALIPVAAGVLYPFFGVTFRPEYAGLAMALSSVTVVSLSLLLKRYNPPAKEVKG
jgi:Cu+-exporting ATPase